MKVAKAILAELTPSQLDRINRAVSAIERFQQHDLERIRSVVLWVEEQRRRADEPRPTLRARIRAWLRGDQ